MNSFFASSAVVPNAAERRRRVKEEPPRRTSGEHTFAVPISTKSQQPRSPRKEMESRGTTIPGRSSPNDGRRRLRRVRMNSARRGSVRSITTASSETSVLFSSTKLAQMLADEGLRPIDDFEVENVGPDGRFPSASLEYVDLPNLSDSDISPTSGESDSFPSEISGSPAGGLEDFPTGDSLGSPTTQRRVLSVDELMERVRERQANKQVMIEKIKTLDAKLSKVLDACYETKKKLELMDDDMISMSSSGSSWSDLSS